jgi:hypothetical protein
VTLNGGNVVIVVICNGGSVVIVSDRKIISSGIGRSLAILSTESPPVFQVQTLHRHD